MWECTNLNANNFSDSPAIIIPRTLKFVQELAVTLQTLNLYNIDLISI